MVLSKIMYIHPEVDRMHGFISATYRGGISGAYFADSISEICRGSSGGHSLSTPGWLCL